MDFDETMVEEEFDDVEADDTLPDDIIEEDESYDDEFPEAEELELPDEEEEPVEEEQPEPEPPKEPGWIKQRVNKAVEKAVAAALAQQREEFEQEMKPIRERMMEDEAQELVRTRKVADIETARELVRLRRGQAPQPQKQEQPRNDQGQFVSKEQIAREASQQAQIQMLARQADKIKKSGGPDVMAEFERNQDVKDRIINGEIDFYDVAEMMKSSKKRRPPTPTRSPNGASNVTPNAFMSMSDKQFERFERNLDEGGRYTLR